MILNKTKTKKQIYSLLVTILLVTSVFVHTGYASSFSSNYSLNDESLSYSNNSDTLESSSYSMDMSNLYWTDRTAESSSYSVIDSNSVADTGSSVTPTTPGTGVSGSVAGGTREKPDSGESDSATLIALEEVVEEEEGEDLNLHSSPDEPFEDLFEDLYRRATGEDFGDFVEEIQPKLVAKVVYPQVDVGGEDSDACSFSFENRFLGSNPYMPDTDKDEIEDCDEALIYGLNPLVNDEIEGYLGISNIEGLVYTEKAPLFVGHAKNPIFQIEITKTDPFVSFGLFFLAVQGDDNFAEISEVEFEDGTYEAHLLYEDNSQPETEIITIDSSLEYETLELSLPKEGRLDSKNNIIQINGTTGAYYGIVAVWEHESFVDVSAVVSDWDGNFEIYSPQSLEDDEYKVTLYALLKQDDLLVQTNYQEVNFKLESEGAYVLEEAEKQNELKIQPKLKYLKADVGSIDQMHLERSTENTNYMYLLSFSIFLLFSLATFFTLCRKK
ncbi:hypothetical protein ACFL3C_02875 [Patescibacteria group bacterium]